MQIKQGESLLFAFSLDKNGSPLNLAGSSILFQVREDLVDNGVYKINKTITENSDIDTIGKITAPKDGMFSVKIDDSETASLSTLKSYFLAIYLVSGDLTRCISANDGQSAQFIVLNP